MDETPKTPKTPKPPKPAKKPGAARPKPAASRAAGAKAKPAAAAPRPAKPALVVANKPATAAEEVKTLRKKELLSRVVEATGAKKKDVKDVVEATLKAMGDALSEGEMLVLPPFGKARVNRQKDLSSGEMIVVKLRRGDGPAPGAGGNPGGGKGAGGKGGKAGKDDLADDDD